MRKNILILILASIFVLVLNLTSSSADCLDCPILKSERYSAFKLHEEPSFFSKKITTTTPEVMWLKKRVNAYILVSFARLGKEYTGWVFGGYYGMPMPGDYKAFPKPVLYKVKVKVRTGSVWAREAPSISSPRAGHCAGCKLWIVGKKGAWLKTNKGKWIYYDLLEPAKPS